jgi:LysR family transcriptional regulator for bpeEF and oprC
MQYLAQCREILALIEHSESSLSESVARPQGRLRVDMPAGIAHFIVMPHLQDFTGRYPDIYLMIGVSDRPVDLIQEGVDCVIRTGELNNSSLVARPLGRFRWVTLRVTGLSSGIWRAAVTGGALSAPGALFLRPGEAGR